MLQRDGAGIYFNVSQLLMEPSGSRRAYNVDAMLSLADENRVSHVYGEVDLLRTDRGVWGSAHLEASMPCTCSRCLVEYEQRLRITIEDEYFPLVDGATGTSLDGGDENAWDSYIDKNHVLDMSETVKQYSALSIPMKPVCREGCLGICFGCGVNMNETSCQCDITGSNETWGPLLELARSNDETDD